MFYVVNKSQNNGNLDSKITKHLNQMLECNVNFKIKPNF